MLDEEEELEMVRRNREKTLMWEATKRKRSAEITVLSRSDQAAACVCKQSSRL